VKGDYSQFLDAKALNFQLKEGSKVYTDIAGFQRIPFEKIGLTIDAYRTALPVLAPRISPVGCAFIGKVEVTISSDPARKDMAVRYTLDGREPSRRSPLYVRPFELTQGATVRARAFSTASARVAPSTVAIASYRKVEFKTGDPLYLSDLPEEGGAFAHGGVKKDANYAATGDFRLAGKTYKKGLMTCPEAAGGGGRSHVAYALSSLPLKFTRFKAMVGIDGAMGTRGSVVFLVDVHRGGKWVEAFKSAVLRGGKAAVVDVDIAGAEKLRLRTTDAGDNIHADHAVWADARVE